MKKGILLYRMSTDLQDLETQKRVCREYCKENNIEIIEEYFEEDVSGYKTPLKDRVELLKILSRAEKDKDFDTLVFYVRDRIIRRNDEAPIVLSMLSKSNIECIEAKTGESIRNDDLQDNLMNYLSFWMAEFESAKISMRVKDALRTKNENNFYTGGKPPFGYEIYETDKVNKKGKIIKDIRINKEESEIIKKIFDWCVNKNMGSLSIADELNKQGYKNRPVRRKDKELGKVIEKETIFWQATIVKILKNPVYIGRKRYNTIKTLRDKKVYLSPEEWKTQDYREDLRIIDDDLFFKSQELLENRKIETGKHKSVVSNSDVLCSGLAFCQCGSKLHVSYSVSKNKKKDGSISEYVSYRYVCRDGRNYNKIHKEKYGKTYYSAKKYDNYAEKTLLDYIKKMDINIMKQLINKNKGLNLIECENKLQNLEIEKDKSYKNIIKFEDLLDVDIENKDIYIKGIRRNEEKIKEIQSDITKVIEEMEVKRQQNTDYETVFNNIKEFNEVYEKSDFKTKKIMLGTILKRIIFKDNGIELILKGIYRNTLKNDVSLQVHSQSKRYANTHNLYDLKIDGSFDNIKGSELTAI